MIRPAGPKSVSDVSMAETQRGTSITPSPKAGFRFDIELWTVLRDQGILQFLSVLGARFEDCNLDLRPGKRRPLGLSRPMLEMAQLCFFESAGMALADVKDAAEKALFPNDINARRPCQFGNPRAIFPPVNKVLEVHFIVGWFSETVRFPRQE
jgi:hypothetical protein